MSAALTVALRDDDVPEVGAAPPTVGAATIITWQSLAALIERAGRAGAGSKVTHLAASEFGLTVYVTIPPRTVSVAEVMAFVEPYRRPE